MAEITAKDVQALRKKTGAGILDCRNALEATDGDPTAAERWLLEKGKVSAGKRSDRERSQGAVAVVVNDGDTPVGAIAALECETDFVAKSSEFLLLVTEIASEVAAAGEEAAGGLVDRIEKLAIVLKENIALGRTVRFEGTSDSSIGSYLHIQSGRGVNAVLVELHGGSDELAHDVAVHIAFARPEYLSREDVPAALVDEARETAEAIARNEGKPDAALPKIVEGRLQGWYKDRVLTDQPYVKDEKQTIAQLLGAASIIRFAQVVVGA